jgi:hypothetical protein
MAGAGGGASATGIRGRITKNSALNGAELDRDTDVAFGTAETIQTFATGELVHNWEDSLPLNDTTYYYRHRETRTGYTASSYSAGVSGKPTNLSGPA